MYLHLLIILALIGYGKSCDPAISFTCCSDGIGDCYDPFTSSSACLMVKPSEYMCCDNSDIYCVGTLKNGSKLIPKTVTCDIYTEDSGVVGPCVGNKMSFDTKNLAVYVDLENERYRVNDPLPGYARFEWWQDSSVPGGILYKFLPNKTVCDSCCSCVPCPGGCEWYIMDSCQETLNVVDQDNSGVFIDNTFFCHPTWELFPPNLPLYDTEPLSFPFMAVADGLTPLKIEIGIPPGICLVPPGKRTLSESSERQKKSFGLFIGGLVLLGVAWDTAIVQGFVTGIIKGAGSVATWVVDQFQAEFEDCNDKREVSITGIEIQKFEFLFYFNVTNMTAAGFAPGQLPIINGTIFLNSTGFDNLYPVIPNITSSASKFLSPLARFWVL